MSLRCPYHGWTYELSGALCDAPHAPKDLDRAEHALSSVRVGVWQGFVFVALGEGAPSLKDVTHKAPSWLTESDLSHARRVHQSEYTVTANWKLLVENFQESDHFARIHPALERLTPNAAARSVLGEGPWLGGTMTFADGVETVSQSGRRLGRAFVASPQYRRQVSDALLFPALLTSLQPDYLLTYRLYPLSPERTTVVAETFFHPASHPAEGDPADIDDVVSFWNGVNDEDRSICERQQIGVQSRGYRSSRYSLVEDGVHAFDSLVARAYLS
jgi:Rieske 2Fe-2S family protein